MVGEDENPLIVRGLEHVPFIIFGPGLLLLLETLKSVVIPPLSGTARFQHTPSIRHSAGPLAPPLFGITPFQYGRPVFRGSSTTQILFATGTSLYSFSKSFGATETAYPRFTSRSRLVLEHHPSRPEETRSPFLPLPPRVE